MATTITAGITTSTALNITTDTSGVLNFQTAGSVSAMTISSTGVSIPGALIANTATITSATIASATIGTITSATISSATVANLAIGSGSVTTALGQGNASTLKNRIINGAMVIDQRNSGASVTPTNGQYSLDRWYFFVSQSSKLTAQQSSTAPAGFNNSLLITSSSAYSIGSGDFFSFQQKIEGYNVGDLNWGTANAKNVTLSFWVQSSLTGTFGGAFGNGAANRSYPFTYSIPVANTWTQISITIAGDTTGTWATNNTAGLAVYFSLGTGSTLSGTAGAWAAGNYQNATGATSVVGTNGATFYITGVQLEVGSSATGFEYRQYGQEFALCQRYYEVCSTTYLQAAQAGGGSNIVTGQYRVTKRATPTLTLTQVVGSGGGQFSNTVDNWSASAAVDGNGRIGWSATSSAEL